MALGSVGKVGISAGIGVGSAIMVDSAITYWGKAKDEQGKDNWYYGNASLIGGGVGLLAALALYKLWGTEEAVACGVAAIGTALAMPAHDAVVEAMKATPATTPTQAAWARAAMSRAA